MGINNNAPQLFKNNKLITKFNELQYFTKIPSIPGNWAGGRFWGFYGCSNLTEITLPDSVTSLGDGAFYGCSKLKHLDFKNVRTISRQCFEGSALQEAVLNEGFTSLSAGLTGYGALNNLRTLTYVDLPSTTTNIGGQNFRYSPPILVCRATTPPTLATQLNSAPTAIYVPQASLEAYAAATGWSSQASKLRAIEGTWYETHRSLEE